MQAILFFLLTFFSCGIAQGKNHPESADNNLLDVKTIPSAEESYVQKHGDGASVNVEEILRELNEGQAKNRDLNQLISDILERMADMERDIVKNEEKIDQAQSSVVLLSKDVDDLTDEVTAVQDDVVSVAADVESLSSSDQLQSAQIKGLGTRGNWCGCNIGPFNSKWSIITYDRLDLSDHNMEWITETPLDIETGN